MIAIAAVVNIITVGVAVLVTIVIMAVIMKRLSTKDSPNTTAGFRYGQYCSLILVY